ncbi:6-bladed beta-propeller [uncultured Sanguibacteroides sp.]|uniref:6-bladed beta-propeller n=1 Tax=uncultured Sanguibacteroides sp. TaxID=1635151 RepID=UPI0025FC6B0A|nr:6-bladed beta-propeller [uncultured Sanguibacteroides sp.]
MKAIFMVWVLLFLGGGFISAREKGRVRVLRPLEQCERVTDLDKWVERVEVIPLDKVDGITVWSHKVLLAPDGKLILWDNQYIAFFDASGKHLFTIGKECMPEDGNCGNIRDIALDFEKNALLALDWQGDVQLYDLTDGRWLGRIHPEYSEAGDAYEIVPSTDGSFFLYLCTLDESSFSKAFDQLLLFDKAGKKIGSYLPRADYTIPFFLISPSYDRSYYIRTQGGDHFYYKVRDGKLEKEFKIDFGERTIPSGYAFSPLKGDESQIQYYLRADYFKMPIYFHATSKEFYFSASGPQAQAYYFLYPEHKQKGIYWVGEEGAPVRFYNSDKDYFYTILWDDCKELKKVEDIQKIKDPLKHCILERIGLIQLSTLHFPFITKVKFKS